MKALTVRQPWAALIAAGLKDVENRTWTTSYRGSLAVHAAACWDVGAEQDPRVAAAWPAVAWPGDPDRPAPDAPAFSTRGAIVAVVRVADVHRDAGCCRPWGSHGGYHWVLADVWRLSVPVPMVGRLGLWELPDGTVEL